MERMRSESDDILALLVDGEPMEVGRKGEVRQ
jgi:hypothetical protein